MLEELWTEVCNIVQEVVNKTIRKKNRNNKVKWLSEEAFQIAEERRETKSKGEGGKVHPTKGRVPKNSMERQEGLLQ